MLQNAALSATRALQVEDEREQRRRLRVSLEQLHFLFARLAEGREVAEDRDPKEVARWLEAPNAALDGERPADLLAAPGQAENLMRAAIASRMSIAT